MTHWENLPSSSEVEHLTVNQNVAGSIPAWAANVDSSSIGRAPDCGSGGCEFDSHLSTQGPIVQLGLGLRIVNPATWVQIPLGPPPKEIMKYV